MSLFVLFLMWMQPVQASEPTFERRCEFRGIVEGKRVSTTAIFHRSSDPESKVWMTVIAPHPIRSKPPQAEPIEFERGSYSYGAFDSESEFISYFKSSFTTPLSQIAEVELYSVVLNGDGMSYGLITTFDANKKMLESIFTTVSMGGIGAEHCYSKKK